MLCHQGELRGFCHCTNKEETMDPLKPNATLLVKLGSLIVHFEEWQSAKGHQFDRIAIETLQNDPDVQSWFAAMHKMAMLPVKR